MKKPTPFPDRNATTVFVNVVPGIDVNAGITTITLGHQRMRMTSKGPAVEEIVVVRVAMETAVAERMAGAISRAIQGSRTPRSAGGDDVH